jgi:hypothetical protein
MWGSHMFPQFKAHIEVLGRQAAVTVDSLYVSLSSSDTRAYFSQSSRMDAIPRWRNLNHFETVTTLTFNDGSKHDDISKVPFAYFLNAFVTI